MPNLAPSRIETPVNRASRIPALIVSGFLGSGKTTVVRHLLADAQREGARIAVISNEFGELGIDGALLSDDGDGDGYVELQGGCVCCRLSDELVDTLVALRERMEPDRVIVETSGVALPFDVQMNFWREPVASWIEDDVALIVVNAEQLAAGRDLDGTFEQQVSSADLLVLNKVDLVPTDILPRLESMLREIEPEAPLIRAVHGDVDPLLLFPPDPDGLRARRRRAGASPTQHHHEQFDTDELPIEPGVDEEALVARLRALGALRCKGFVETSEGLRLVQGVGARVELSVPRSVPPSRLVGRVVVIRRHRAE
jgi:cobalamin biosynthesis protein CobW